MFITRYGPFFILLVYFCLETGGAPTDKSSDSKEKPTRPPKKLRKGLLGHSHKKSTPPSENGTTTETKPPKKIHKGLLGFLGKILTPVVHLVTEIPAALGYVLSLIKLPDIGINLGNLTLDLPIIKAGIGNLGVNLRNITTILQGGPLPNLNIGLGNLKLGLGKKNILQVGGLGLNV